LIRARLVQSAHDVSEGGLFINWLESAMPKGLGFDCQTQAGLRKDGFLFGEAQGRVMVSIRPDDWPAVQQMAADSGVPVEAVGTVTDGSLSVDGHDFGLVEHWRQDYDEQLGKEMS
jgi:phosphoribosylformylglycinamidine synthase